MISSIPKYIRVATKYLTSNYNYYVNCAVYPQFLAINTILFIIFSLIYYYLFPQFLIQSFDAQNFYEFTKGHNKWKSSEFDQSVFYPIAGMGSNVWQMT